MNLKTTSIDYENDIRLIVEAVRALDHSPMPGEITFYLLDENEHEEETETA